MDPVKNRIEIRRVSKSLKDFGLQAEAGVLASRGFRIVSIFPEGEHYVIVGQAMPVVQRAVRRPGARG